MCMQRCIRAQRHLHQILTGSNRTCIHHRTIEVVDTELCSVENATPLVHVSAQIHCDREQPIAIRKCRPFGQRNVFAKDARSSQPNDMIGVQKHGLRELGQRERHAKRHIGIVNGFQGGIDQVEKLSEPQY